jgi:hypothetical protein
MDATMKYRLLIPTLLLLAAALACGPSQSLAPTHAAPTQTQTASAPASPTIFHLPTQPPADTASPSATHRPTVTPRVTDTVAPADTASAADTSAPDLSTPVPTASPTPTKKPTARPGSGGVTAASFLDTVTSVKKQVENFGGQIDIAVHSGTIDCQQTVNSYEFVAARATINGVPASLAGAYGLYTQALGIFIPKAADLYTNCKNYLANPNGGTIPVLTWTVARTAVNDAGQLLRQAIIAAGGTP